MTSISPDKEFRKMEEEKSVENSAQKSDDNYDFLAYASLMESKASVMPKTNG